MAGMTWVSVAPTHRRQGLLRRLVDAVHADADERGEPMAGLQASEAAIYERFGYGAATRWRHVEIDRRRVQIAEAFRPGPGGITMIDPLEHIEGGPDGASASSTDSEPDLSMTRAAMGALVLGGVTATELAAAGRLAGDDFARADVFFGWSPTPHCTTTF